MRPHRNVNPSQKADRERHRRFLDLYDPVSDRLERYARSMTSDGDDALDLVSETVMIAYEKMDTVRDPASFLGFVLTIARHVFLRRRSRGFLFRPLVEADAETFPAPGPSPELSTDVRLLYDALAMLPLRQREAVVLFEIVGLPLAEIRAVQGGTLSGVKARVARGRRKLVALLAPRDTSATARERGEVRLMEHLHVGGTRVMAGKLTTR